MTAIEHLDVIVVGAGLSGISQAWHLQTRCPDRSYAILEARDAIGGTWDLFRYPGIRSDSDMHTLGFRFRPWRGARAIADGDTIRRYIEETAREHGIDRHIRFGTAVRAMHWSISDARWTIETDGPEGPVTLTAGFVVLGTGYYDYDRGHDPEFAGRSAFAGQIVHPQHWPAALDWSGKRVAVIGSGATAVTLVPALARTAAHVTMVQRSPSYIVAHSADDRVARTLAAVLPGRFAARLTRWKNIALDLALYRITRRWPGVTGRWLVRRAAGQAGPSVDAGTDLTPSYAPWDQRVCLAPDADLFVAMREGRASIVTGAIDRFVADGIRLSSGRDVPADLVVTATGLRVKVAGGVALAIDGRPITLAGRLQYKGMMFDGVPNLAMVFGYTNASWTLKADLTAAYVCRLLREMARRRVRQATPVNRDEAMKRLPFVDFTSGYVRRAADLAPVQGDRSPWRLHQNYLLDVLSLRFGRLDDAVEFGSPS